jgi:ABC-2 type transport system ATP-binding protein
MEPLAVSVKGLKKVYLSAAGESCIALNNIDLAIPQGSFCALLGPNGAGKSTIIGILAGLTSKTSGEVKVMGYDLDLEPKLVKKSIGVVPQKLAADVYFPVKESLELYAGYYGIRNPDVNGLLAMLGLLDKKDATPRELSGGMMRRLLIAKALVHKPSVVILDEPTAGVDIALRDQLYSSLMELNRAGATVLITTHYLQEAEALCNLFVFINEGKIIATKSKKEIDKELSSKKVITLHLSERVEVIPQRLAKYEPKSENHSLTFNCYASEIEGLFGEILASGISIADLEVSKVDLEAVFKSLVFGRSSSLL